MPKLGEVLLDLYEDVYSEKVLGFFTQEGLKFLEDLLSIDLGVRNRKALGKDPRSARPFVKEHYGEMDTLFFLTSKEKDIELDLKQCSRFAKECKWIKDKSYVLHTSKYGYAGYKIKHVLIRNRYTICGGCKDLWMLDNLKVVEVR